MTLAPEDLSALIERQGNYFAAGDFLRAVGGRLVASDPQSDRILRDIFIAAGNGDAAIGVKGIALPLTGRDGERHVAHVLPLTSGARRGSGIAYAAAAAVLVHKAALETPSPPEAIAKAYKLTPTELRILPCYRRGGRRSRGRGALGISEGTVKTHLHHLFEKTNTTRQAELVKLVAGYANALLR